MSEAMARESKPNFMQLALQGYALPDDIDDFVDDWHDGASNDEIYEFLGMTLEEYTLWVSNPDSLPIIITARHRHIPLVNAVNDNIVEVERIAARADQSWKIARLRSWIEQQRQRPS
jgi:hypothetical protein